MSPTGTPRPGPSDMHVSDSVMLDSGPDRNLKKANAVKCWLGRGKEITYEKTLYAVGHGNT